MHTLHAAGLKRGVTKSCCLFANSSPAEIYGRLHHVMIVNADSTVKFIVGPRSRVASLYSERANWRPEIMARIQAAIAKNPEPSPWLAPTTWEEQHTAMSAVAVAAAAAPMPVAPPSPLGVSDQWPDSESEVEVTVLNGPSLETRGFFQVAHLLSYMPAVEQQENWWDIQDVAATNDLTTLLWEINMKKFGHVQRFMHYLDVHYPRAQDTRFHRLARSTGKRARTSSSPLHGDVYKRPHYYQSVFMIGKYLGDKHVSKKLKGAQAAALVHDTNLGFDKPVLTRAASAKSPSARSLVSRVKHELKLW